MYELGSAKTEASVIYIGNSGGVKRRLQAHKRGDDGSCTKNAAYYRVDYRSDYRTLDMRLEGLAGSYMTWCIGDPIASGGWGSSQIAMLTRLAPQIRQFVQVRQALVGAQAQSATVTALLDNPRIGVVQLDRRGRILAANDRACGILRDGDGVSDRGCPERCWF